MNTQLLSPTTESNALLMQYITKLLIELGIKPNLKGFNYLKEAIYLHSVIIYTVITDKCCASAKNVERSIRTSIEAVWYRNTLNRSHKLFESAYINADYPPNNTIFIATMSEIIKLTVTANHTHTLTRL